MSRKNSPLRRCESPVDTVSSLHPVESADQIRQSVDTTSSSVYPKMPFIGPSALTFGKARRHARLGVQRALLHPDGRKKKTPADSTDTHRHAYTHFEAFRTERCQKTALKLLLKHTPTFRTERCQKRHPKQRKKAAKKEEPNQPTKQRECTENPAPLLPNQKRRKNEKKKRGKKKREKQIMQNTFTSKRGFLPCK